VVGKEIFWQEPRSSGGGKIATTHWVITQQIVAILPLPQEGSSQLLRSGTLKMTKIFC